MESVEKKLSWKFPRTFWVANVVELLERAAWYGVFVAITLYLSRILAFSDIEAGLISGIFSAGLYFLPTFSGALADQMGFKKALLLAFFLLTVGYASMWVLPTLLESAGLVEYGRVVHFLGLKESWHKWLFIPIMLIIMVGGSFIKSVITGTVATETSGDNRARGYSIFYAMVNIGAFSGKTIVKPLRESMGNEGLIVLNLFAAGMTLLAFIGVFFFFRSERRRESGKTLNDIWHSLIAVCSRGRLLILIFIITGFWMVQHQLYATMPKYVLRMAGEGASPSWYANVNPAVVVLTVSLVTQLMRKVSALGSMTVGMFIMPLSAFCMAAGNMMSEEPILGLHPVALMMIVGIAFQGLAESFISPRYLEYFSKQAPAGEEGLYLGFSHLHSFISSILGFGLSGFLLDKYCPSSANFATDAEWIAAKAHAHYIWLVFVAIASISAISLVVFGFVTRKMDKEKMA
ncbi:MAG: MFS transporter [Acidobacteria bacterium]|nr:MAG: MFS transporter [Acidobacteriota bacterium]